MKKPFVFLGTAIIVIAFLASFAAIARADETATAPAGQQMFMDKKCTTCHSIESLKIEKKMASSKAPDLSTVGDTRTAEWITKWLNKEEAIDGKKHPFAWAGKPEEQKTLVDWLVTLKKEQK